MTSTASSYSTARALSLSAIRHRWRDRCVNPAEVEEKDVSAPRSNAVILSMTSSRTGLAMGLDLENTVAAAAVAAEAEVEPEPDLDTPSPPPLREAEEAERCLAVDSASRRGRNPMSGECGSDAPSVA